MSPRPEGQHRQAGADEEGASSPHPPASAEGGDAQTVVFPRRKAGQNKRPSTQAPVVVTLETLREVFDMPLWKACKALGICATAMKKVCRKLGVMEWPYKKNHMPGKRAKTAAAAPSDASSASPSPTPPSSSSVADPPRPSGAEPAEPAPEPEALRAVRTRAKAGRGAPARTRSHGPKGKAGEGFVGGGGRGGGGEVVVVESSSGSETHETEAADCMSPEELIALPYDAEDFSVGSAFALCPPYAHDQGGAGGGQRAPSAHGGLDMRAEAVWGDLDGAWLGDRGLGAADQGCMLVGGELDFLG